MTAEDPFIKVAEYCPISMATERFTAWRVPQPGLNFGSTRYVVALLFSSTVALECDCEIGVCAKPTTGTRANAAVRRAVLTFMAVRWITVET